MKFIRRFLVFMLALLAICEGFPQCISVHPKLAAEPAGACNKGTNIIASNSYGGGIRKVDGSIPGTGGGSQVPGYQRYTFSMASLGDTLRICNNSKIQLTSQVRVLIIEAGSTLLFQNTSLGGNAYIVNYGTIIFDRNTSVNASAVLINATFNSVIDAGGFNIAVSGNVVNNGYIKNVNSYTFNDINANTCLGDLSAISAQTVTVTSGISPFTATLVGQGCVQAQAYTGACLTANGGAAQSNSHLKFAGCSGSSLPDSTSNNCPSSGSGFGSGLRPSNPCSACISPLPITLKSFTAAKTSEGVLLSWSTLSHWSSDYFIIERSINGKDWVLIGQVKSVDQYQGLLDFSLTDPNPSAGVSYYKLSEVDVKGNKQDYAVEKIEIKRDFIGFSIHPNPASGNITVKINGEPNVYQFEVFDLTGKCIAKRKLSSGSNYLEDIFASAGLYIAKLKVGPDYYTQKIVVQ